MTRIREHVEENLYPVVGLREGSWLRVEDGSAILGGPHTARLFRQGADPREADPGRDLIEELRV